MEVSGQLHAFATLSPKERTPGTQWKGSCMGSEPIWTFTRKLNLLTLPGIKPQILQHI